ncbi:SDR family oxidoreductase [Aggregicoccus sp. 17bor-14]|uniref:SDR family oxidoreductase n=1 Tax=Myxococcaceae TaxID=31 RepID=UPI00129C608B|nr:MULTISPECIES: SDR family oxidoreductase [Myxococcaceae]MBF5045038.1 SDR family oxidoreductase [Simulacricoccus sp. 17bor-14]MRI90780.1 SDR family oxidoreductase [Aggregicoccus sp. 17bor-14]
MAKNPDPRSVEQKPPFPPQHQDSPGSEAAMRPAPDFGEQSYKGMGRLTGRVALITGADSGIGRAVALAFAREGADVAIAYLDEHEDAKETQRVVEAAGRKALLLPGDLGDPAHAERVVKQTLERLGKLDILVNNAAYQGEAVQKLEEITPERVERTFRTNIMAMFFLTRAALPHLKAGASVINTASIQAYQPSPNILDYASTKGAIVAFTKGLAGELVERGMRANAVAPGPVWTPLIAQSYDAKKVSEFGKQSPMGRPAQPAELAPSYVFLASDESRYVNGDILGVTGGMLLA